MLLLECLVLLTAALCCSTSPPGHCGIPERSQELELQGEWPDESYPPGKLAVFNCRPGYSRLGAIKKVCSEGKWISTSSGKCRKKPCGHPEDIPFGFFELKEGDEFVFGAVVEYFCDEGYQMVSKQKTRECTANGWSNFPPHCEARKCPPVVPAEGVNVISSSYDEEFSMGQVVRFECKNPRLKLEGPSEVFCTSEGEWNEQPPICKEASCNVPEIPNGSVDNPIPIYKENEKLSYKCDEKYKVYQRSEATCTKNGWSPEPACTEIICYPEYVANGKLEKTKDIYRDGEIIDLKCDYGFQIEHKPDEPRVCTATGWSPPPKCISKKCNKPNIENGHLYYNWVPKSLGNYIVYYCNSGYLPPSKDDYGRSLCSENGWNPPPRCLKTCSHQEASVENAYLENPERIYLSGDKVKFTCYNGYSTPNGRENGEKECLPNGRFTQAKCSKTCEMRQLLNGKYSPNKSVFDVGEYIRFECNEGFMIKTRKIIENAQCLYRGWSVIPECIEITCTVQNSQLISEKRQYKYGDVVQFSCPRGYKIIGSDKSQCFHYGWGPSLPTCEVTRCTVQNWQLKSQKRSYNFGDIAQFSCPPGTKLIGSERSRCDHKGWEPSLPTCETTKCQLQLDSKTSKVPKKKEYKVGEKVKVSCKKNFILVGSSEITCHAHGWEPEVPSCKAKTSDEPTDDTEGIIQPATKCQLQLDSTASKDPKKKEYEVGEKVKVSCKKNFILVGSSEITCHAHGWEPEVPSCKAKTSDEPTDDTEGIIQPAESEEPSTGDKEARLKCPPASSPPNAEIVEVKNEYYDGDTIEIRCVHGFTLYGPAVIHCQNGKWNSFAQCIQLHKCEKPPSITDGEIIEETKSRDYFTGHIVKYRCNRGFHIIGSVESQCTEGKWLSPPECIGDSCEKPPPVANGAALSRKVRYEHGDSIEYVCHKGFKKTDNTPSKCLEGKWWNIPTCVSTTCDSPPSIDNGHLKYPVKNEYQSGEKVHYECRSGYAFQNNKDEAICEEREWKSIPVCRRKGERCIKPPTVKFGDYLGERRNYYESGSYVEYKCPDFYKMQGNKFVRCQDGVWGEPPTCLEPCTAKEIEMKQNNIVLRWEAASKLYSEHGDNIEFACIHEHEIANKTELRTKCNQGVIPYPKCVKTGSCYLSQSEMKTRNVYLNKTKEILPGETVTFECYEGMVPETSLSATCVNRKLNYPKCVISKKCTSVPEILNGKIRNGLQDSYESGSSVEFECNENYMLSGSINVKCENGIWVDLPRCLRPCKILKKDLNEKNIALQSSDDLDKIYKDGEEVEIKCNSGFRNPNPSSSLKGECSDGTMKYQRCFSGSTCRLNQDQFDEFNLELDPVHNDIYYGDGEDVIFKCKMGFSSTSELTRKCTKTQLTYPRCIPSGGSPV